MAKYFTSDLHFYHKRICELTNRGLFTNPDDHTSWVLDIINKQVKPSDTLYHLGDMVFISDNRKIEDILSRINCQVVCIKGNHCSRKTWKKVQSNKLIAFKDYDEIKIGDKDAILFHFPISVWHKQHYGSLMIHGHCHGSFQGEGKILDVGLDNAYNLFGTHRLFTEQDILDSMAEREVVVKDHHEVRENHEVRSGEYTAKETQ